MPNASDRNWVEIQCKPFSFGRLIHRLWEMRWGLLMREKETKEEKYRENWLARQSRAIQAEAAKIGAETLKRWAWQKEGKCTGAILQLKLNNICEKSKQAGCSVAFRTTIPSETSLDAMVLKEGEIEVNKSNISLIEPSTSMLCNKMVLKESNNSNIGNISVIKPTISMSCNNMALKEATKQANMGKKLCKYCTKMCNPVNTDSKMYICSGKGIKGLGPPSMEGESDK